MNTLNKLILLLLLTTWCCPSVLAQLISETVAGELGNKVDAHLTLETRKGFSGAVLVVKDGKVIVAMFAEVPEVVNQP